MPAKSKTLFITQFSILLALEALTCFTPLGSLPIGPIVATLACVPVIVTALLLGTAAGAAMGGIAGIFSLIVWTFMPPQPVIAFVFSPFYTLGTFTGNAWSLFICIVPRILVGVVAGLCFSFLKRVFASGKKDALIYGLSGALGSLANTFFVLGGIYLAFGARYAEAVGLSYSLLLGVVGLTILTNGLPEALIGALVAYFVCKPIRKYIIKG